MDIKEVERLYADMLGRKAILQMDHAKAVEALVGPENYRMLLAMEDSLADDLKAVDAEAEPYKERFKEMILALGSTYDGKLIQGQWVKPSYKIVDLPGLMAFAKRNPDVLAYFKLGDPSTRIVPRKG